MKQQLRNVPALGALAHKAYRVASRFRDVSTLGRLSRMDDPAAKKVVRAIRMLEDGQVPRGHDGLAAIERNRERLSAEETPLAAADASSGPFDEGQTIAQACRASKPRQACHFMYALVTSFRPQRVLELGTNLGISSAYQAMALMDLGDGGRLVTLEGSSHRLAIAEDLHDRLGLDNVSYRHGLFTETLDGALETLKPVDFAFIDGHHQYEPTLDYLEKILAASTEEALFVFDDINWSSGMERAWREIAADARLGLVLDFTTVGVCVRRRSAEAQHLVLPRVRTVLGAG